MVLVTFKRASFIHTKADFWGSSVGKATGYGLKIG
jgi:hypothetical protein